MKKRILNLLLIFACGSTFAQNVQDQKVTFQYIQLPLKHIDKSLNSYQLEIKTELNEKNNQDSLDTYNSKLLLWQANFDTWLQSKKAIDKAFLLELAKHEKAVNAGNTAAVYPTRPAYPKQPIKEEIKMPILTEDVQPNIVETAVKLEGFTKGSSGATVTVELMGFKNARIIETKSGSGATTKYTYTSESKYPIKISVSTASQGTVFTQIIGDQIDKKVIKTKYDSKYDYQYWAVDNLAQFWIQRQKEVLAKNLAALNTIMNDNCGYAKRTRSTEIFTVKKFKAHSYNDLVDAYSKVNAGYNLIIKDRNHASSKSKIMAGIAIWEKALGESNMGDNKSRINKKVTALLFVNLAEAYMWIDDFDTAENYRLKAEQAGVLKYKSASKKLEKLMIVAKDRYEINN